MSKLFKIKMFINEMWDFFEQSVFYYAFYFQKFVGGVFAHFCTLHYIVKYRFNYELQKKAYGVIVVLSIPSLNSEINIKYIQYVKKKRWEKRVRCNIDFTFFLCYYLFHKLRATYSYLWYEYKVWRCIIYGKTMPILF